MEDRVEILSRGLPRRRRGASMRLFPSRCWRPWDTASWTPSSRSATGFSVPAAGWRCRPSPFPTRSTMGTAAAPTGSASTSFPAATAVARGDPGFAGPADGPGRRRAGRHRDPALRDDLAPMASAVLADESDEVRALGLRRSVHSNVGFLPGDLRGSLPHRQVGVPQLILARWARGRSSSDSGERIMNWAIDLAERRVGPGRAGRVGMRRLLCGAAVGREGAERPGGMDAAVFRPLSARWLRTRGRRHRRRQRTTLRTSGRVLRHGARAEPQVLELPLDRGRRPSR